MGKLETEFRDQSDALGKQNQIIPYSYPEKIEDFRCGATMEASNLDKIFNLLGAGWTLQNRLLWIAHRPIVKELYRQWVMADVEEELKELSAGAVEGCTKLSRDLTD